jgi:hypothetical protein
MLKHRNLIGALGLFSRAGLWAKQLRQSGAQRFDQFRDVANEKAFREMTGAPLFPWIWRSTNSPLSLARTLKTPPMPVLAVESDSAIRWV